MSRQSSITAGPAGRARRRDGGQSLVEFVLVLPILLVLIFGIIEFANAWRTSQIITNTAREAARIIILPDSGSSAGQTAAKQRLNASGLDATKATINIYDCTGASCAGKLDSVTIQYPYSFQFFGPVMNLMCGSGCSSQYGTIQLSSTTVMRNE